ncbi:hypothetical protein ACHAXA_010714 [Cyclostephanos tholiformis]|uniref:Uncharacterized protein n=1 Tax=Cyclostephanos tholiformis TaxID=382380 RepID=A0ABD3RAI0_9STRA
MPGHGQGQGYAKVYRTSDGSGNRVPLGQTVFGAKTGDRFGHSVDIAADGNTIVIGSPGYSDDNRPGYVRVFSLVSDDDLGTNTWEQIGQVITSEVDGDAVGCYVSISKDGKRIAVGAINFVRVYRMDDSRSNWIQIGDDIEDKVAYDGNSMSLSEDGNMLAIGSPFIGINGASSGQVTVYRFDGEGSSWEPLGQTHYGDKAGDLSGWSVDLSPDGKTLAIGSPGGILGDGDRPGYVRVFSLNVSDYDIGTSRWEPIGRDIIGEDDGDEFGDGVSLSYDGKTIAVSADWNDGEYGMNSGHVRVYQLNDSRSDWIPIGGDIDGKAAGDCSGRSVSLSADGDKVAIGSHLNAYNGTGAGHVVIYVLE